MLRVQRSDDNLQKSVFSFHQGLRDVTPVFTLWGLWGLGTRHLNEGAVSSTLTEILKGYICVLFCTVCSVCT